MRAYAIYDSKGLFFTAPFFQATDGAAIRSLADAVADVNSAIGRHPADYVLFYIGDYDELKGAMAPVLPLVHVIDAIGLVRVEAPLPFPPMTSSGPNGSATVKREA